MKSALATLAFIGVGVTTLTPSAAFAADEEIQVYMDEMNPQGGVGLDLHVNHTLAGRLANADYPGQMTSEDRLRITPEWSYGLTSNIELGLYLPLMTLDPHDGFEVGGVKGRIKFIAPRAKDSHFFWGANFEIGRVRQSLDINPWNAELKMIAGYRQGPWTIAGNFNTDFVVSGPDPSPVAFELDTKLGYAVSDKVSLGLESYNDLGSTRQFGNLGGGNQRLFAVADVNLGRWDFDLGVGRGWGDPEDKWVLKAIIGVPID